MSKQIEELQKQFAEMSEAELLEMINTARKERSTVTTQTIKVVKEKTRGKNVGAAIASLSPAQVQELIKRLQAGGK